MKKERISIRGIFIILGSIFIMSMVGISLPQTINRLNNLNLNSYYGNFVSYSISILLFYLISFKVEITTTKPSIFIKYKQWLKNDNNKTNS